MTDSFEPNIPKTGDLRQGNKPSYETLEKERNWCAKNLKSACDKIAEQQRVIDEAKKLLAISVCPQNCIDGAVPAGEDECYQCQFCYERSEILGSGNEQ